MLEQAENEVFSKPFIKNLRLMSIFSSGVNFVVGSVEHV